MSTPLSSSIIVSYGMAKSASTFAWMLIKEMVAASGNPVATLSPEVKGNKSREDYILKLEDGQAARIRDEIAGSNVVVKTHSNAKLFGDFQPVFERSFVFVQHRDPREISLSLMDHGRRSRERGIPDFAQAVDIESTLPIIDHDLAAARSWMAHPGAIAISYDELCFDTDATAQRIADALGLTVDIPAVLSKFSEKTNIIQFNKGAKARWREELSDAESEFFLERFQDYYAKGAP